MSCHKIAHDTESRCLPNNGGFCMIFLPHAQQEMKALLAFAWDVSLVGLMV